MTTIPVSQDYLLHITVTDVPTTREKHLKVESQWLGAKRPDERQTRFSLTLPTHKMSEVARTIQEAL